MALYQQEGPSIFTRSPFRLPTFKRTIINALLRRGALDLDAEWLFQSKYRAEPLRTALLSRLAARRLEESRCRLVIPAVDLTAGKVVVFKTPHRPGFVRDRHFSAVDVIMATTAAPSYFPAASITPGSLYCDGGIWANNPALVGYVEAVKIAKECTRLEIDAQFTPDEIHLLSIGTGQRTYFVNANFGDSGLRWWAPRLLNISGEAQSEGIHWQMDYLLSDRYHRVDFDIPEDGWSLDAVTNLQALHHLGSQRAIERFPYLRANFLLQPANKYVPFDV
jgi:hypothetical protein